MSDVSELTEEERAVRESKAAWERMILHEETVKFIDENRAEIIRRAQERIRRGPDEQA